MECYGGGSIVAAIFGTVVVIALLGVFAAWILKNKFRKHNKDPKLVTEDTLGNKKHEYAFDNPAFKGDGGKSSPLYTNWTSPKQQTNDKRKPLDDSYAGMPAPRLVSLKGSDFTGLGVECYGGLKDGIFVKKVAPQGPASGLINIGDRITSLTIDFRHIVQEDAMTILSYASPYNVQLELMDSNKKLMSSEPQKIESRSPKPGRQSPLVHPLVRSSSQSDLNTIERNSRRKLFNNDDVNDYPTLKMDKSSGLNESPMVGAHKENDKKSSSLMQQFMNQITKLEEKFQNRSNEKSKSPNDLMMDEEEGSATIERKEGLTLFESADQVKAKKGMKFGIRVFPANINGKLFGKDRSKSPSTPVLESEGKDEVKICIDEADGPKTTQVTIECENFNRQNSTTSSEIMRDVNGIPQELPAFMNNAALAARDGRKMSNDPESRKSKGKAPRPPMISVDLEASNDTMETNLTMTDTSMNNYTDNNTNNANIEIEDELDRITEKYLSHSNNNHSSFGNSSISNETNESVTMFDKIEDLKDVIVDDVTLRHKKPNNSSTPKCEREDINQKNFALDASDLDLPSRMELNSSDVTVHQSDESEKNCDDSRRAASLGDLSLMKKLLTEKDGNNMERAQSLDITDNNLVPKQSLALALSKPTADLTCINGDYKSTVEATSCYNIESSKLTKNEMGDGDVNKTDHVKLTSYNADMNIPDDIKVIRYPFGSLERPKSDVLRKILGSQATNDFEEIPSTTLPVDFTKPEINDEEIGKKSKINDNIMSIVTIESQPMEYNVAATTKDKLIVDTSEPISLTIVNNPFELNQPSQMSPIFNSDNMGVNNIKISLTDIKPVVVSSTVIMNPPEKHFTENYFIKDNVVTISTDSQASSIQFIDDVKLDFNLQVLNDMEGEDLSPKEGCKPIVIEAEKKVENKNSEELSNFAETREVVRKTNGYTNDVEINNNVSKTEIINGDSKEVVNNQEMSKFLTEIVYKGDESAIENMNESKEATIPIDNSDPSSSNVLTSTKTVTLTNVPLSTANFLKQERRHVEKNFVPQNSEIKFTTSMYESPSSALNNSVQQKEPQKRISQIEQIRQNFEKSAQTSSDFVAPIPVARRSSIPLSIQKSSPSKIPVFNKQTTKTSPSSRTNSFNKLNSSTDNLDFNN